MTVKAPSGSSRMSCTSNKGITTRHWELNVVWKCNIYIHSFFFYITVLSFCLFVIYLRKKNRTFCIKVCDKEIRQINCEVLAFHFSLSFSLLQSVKVFFPPPMYSPLHRWTTFLIVLICLYHRNTTTRTYLSWTWVCWHSLIIYVLCCCTCPNTNYYTDHMFCICLPHHHTSFYVPLLIGSWFTICKMVHETPIW